MGLVVWGISIDKNYHWMVGQVAFFFCKPISTLINSRFQSRLTYGCLHSRRRNPNRKYSYKQLHSRQLPSSIHQRGHILRRIPQSECLYQPGIITLHPLLVSASVI